MRRFVSLDFLRGLMIILMLILHIILRYLDIYGLMNQIDNIPLINIVALVVLPFLGGLAGLFLLVSAVSNQVSMQKYLEEGRNPNELILRQITGGLILLLFAMLTEGLIGYKGALGQSIQYLGNTPQPWWYIATTRYNHFETIHTIAWCEILNGLIQGILSRKGRWQNPRFMIKAYLVLIVIVLVLTQPIWELVRTSFGGFPWGTNPSGVTSTEEPSILFDDIWVVIRASFLGPLAAEMEPIFPYLAVSFIGSIIGIIITLPAEKRPKNFIKVTLKIGLIMFVVGAVGIIFNLINVMMKTLPPKDPFAEAASAYLDISHHRAWYPDNQESWGAYMIPLSWFWQFLGLNGFALIVTMVVFNMVEFRGKAEKFAKKTTFIRRFGIVAFTNYNNQFIFYAVANVITGFLYNFGPTIRYGDQKIDWGYTGLIILITLLIYHGINVAWERIGYVGSIEWCKSTIEHFLIPRLKSTPSANERELGTSTETMEKPRKTKLKWYERGKIDVEGKFYHAQWINLVEVDDNYHQSKRDSHILSRISTFAFIIPVFIPATLFLFPIARKTRQIEGSNQWSNRAYKLCLIGTIITVTFIILLSILTLNMITRLF